MQVSFLHVYHHFSTAWAWWIALKYFPFGDSYFGALFNSWIRVLMYAYYALALCKIPCPWKRFLTQAQLFQFTCVVVYTISSPFLAKEQYLPHHYFAMGVQIWEMASLFVLFSVFYRKSYGKKRKNSGTVPEAADDLKDQCQQAVAAASGVAESAAKEAGEMASTASKVMHDVAKPARRVMNQPSWNMTG